MIQEALFSLLVSDTVVSAIADDRIFPSMMPQGGPMPACVYAKTGDSTPVGFCGSFGISQGIFQFESYGKDPKSAKALASAIRTVLINTYGVVGTTRFASVALTSEVDLDAPEPGLFFTQQTFAIWYEEQS